MPNTPLKPAAFRSAGYILILFDDDIPDIHKFRVRPQAFQIVELPYVNQGIQASTTPYVILLNNDTRADKAFIHELEKAIEKDVRIFSASAKLISLHDMTKLDDAGDYYCALGWAFARGKGKAPALYEKEDRIFAACGGAAI